MKTILTLVLFPLLLLGAEKEEGWISLFDGKSLDGWKANENPDTFKIEDGKIVVFGPRSHLFYTGSVANHDFKNFELKLEIMTFPKANSGVYFHTQWLEAGFPSAGFEVQVNNSHRDPKRTAGLYNIKDNSEAPAKDEEWFTLHIIVRGKQVTTKVNDKIIVEWTEPEAPAQPTPDPAARARPRRLSSGTFALQGHDPESKIFYKNIRVKPLPQ